MAFLDETYLLETPAARELYTDISDLPIVDPHTHADLAEIVENEGWTDIWEVEGATDHYVWAAMRDCGVDEHYITGEATNREKWLALAEVFPQLAGNPTYEWIHLDLKRRFGIDERLSAATGEAIWTKTAEALAQDGMTPQALLREMGVEMLASTDDPAESLELHRRGTSALEGVDIRPTFRLDRAIHVDEPSFTSFIDELGDRTGVDTDDLEGFETALAARHEEFDEHGCVASDVGLRQPVTRPVGRERAARIYDRRLAGHSLEQREIDDFQAFLLDRVGEWNAEKGWVTQLHLGAVRNYRRSVFDRLGPAAGADVSTGDLDIVDPLDHFLNRFDGQTDVVLYTVDPTHYPSVATLARVFPSVSVGPAWWFNDSAFGLERQLEYTASVSLLSSYAGMVSDSRKLMSYGSRFELFRRCLANVLGRLVERGQVPSGVAEELARTVALDRPRQLYGA